MPDDISHALLARYLAGQTSPEETEHVHAWLDAHPQRRLELEGLDASFEVAHRDPEPVLDRILHRSTTPDAPPAAPRRAPDRSGTRRRSMPRYAPFLRVAAVVVGLAVLVFLAQRFIGTDPSPSFRIVTTQPGERSTLTLADGTVVELNVDSRLRMPEAFASSRREVWLDGEAFFDVTPDAERPFLIHSGEAVVEVLGTAFTVEAYTNEARVAVVVQEGRVALRSAATPDTTALLAPGQRGQLTAGRHLTVDAVDPSVHLAWRHGRLVFEGASLAEVARTLARWYDVDVQLADDTLGTLRLDASFDDEPLANVLATIAVALPIDYHMDNRIVTITRP